KEQEATGSASTVAAETETENATQEEVKEPPMPSDFTREAVARYADASRERFEKTLRAIVEIPTVSVEPQHKDDMARGARYAAGLLESMGAKARIYETG